MRANAALAQLVEQFIRNEKVASSNPASGTISQICAHPLHSAAVLLNDTVPDLFLGDFFSHFGYDNYRGQ